MLNKQILKYLAVFALIPWTAAGQNIAAKAVCTVEPAPNYSVTRGKNNAGSLVDGKYSETGFMWLDPLTPGWQHVPKITLNLRLSNPHVIGKITLNTMTNAAAGIGLPLSIHAFASEDGKNFRYLGDMMKDQRESGDQYRKVRCSLTGLAAQATYLRLIVIPSGAFFFSDEIEVFPVTGKGVEKSQSRIMSSAEIDAFLQGNEKASRNRKFLGVQISKELAHSDARQEKLLEALRSRIGRDAQLEEHGRYEFYLREIAQTRIKERSISGKLVLKILPTPWSADLDEAVGSRNGASAHVAVEMPGYRGGTEYLAFSVMNDDTRDMKAVVNWNRSSPSGLRLYTAEQVKTRDFVLVRDALFPLESGQSLSFYPGEVKVIVAAVSPEKAGVYQQSVRFKSKSGESAADLSMEVLDPGPEARREPSLNANVWAYFNTPFLSKRGRSARSDLMEHYVNTIVIPPQFALPAIVCGDVQPLKGYLEYVKGFQNVLLFLDFRGYMTDEQNYFLSDQWKECFLAGYDEILRLLEQKGVKSGNVYLYPFDEIRSNELDKYLEFASWIRSEREDVLLYATVSRENILARMDGHTDICQLLDRKAVLADAGKFRGPQYWIYDIMDQSKSTSPYSRYRLMAWKAFSLDLQGVGFWAYGDIRGEDAFTAWNDFDGNTADRAAVYEQGGAVIPSRRWEAFKQGIGDYDLLRMYARKFGEKEAKALCDLVLSKPRDAREAGRIREQILRELTGN